MLADIEQELTAGIALKVGNHTLFVARGIHLVSSFAVEPHAAFALIGIAAAAERSMVEAVELLVLDVKTMLKIADAELCLAESKVLIVTREIERRTDVEASVGRERNVLHAGVAIVHLVEHHAVGEQVQLW